MKIGIGFDKYPEKYDYIATFKDISGIEGDHIIQENLEGENAIDLCELTLFDCNINKEDFIKNFIRESEKYGDSAYIYILSSKGKILTANFISDIKTSKFFKDNIDNLNVKITGWLHSSSKGFYEIAKKRLVNGISNLGEWKTLPSEKVQGWLEAAISLRTINEDIENRVIEINSDGLNNKDKFYCAIGEAVNGPGGYFGRNLDALEECINGGFGIKNDFTLNWINHEIYKEKFPKYFDDILSVFLDNRKNINLL